MRLVVTSWNLQGSNGVDRDAVAAHLQDQESDVVFLQEVQRHQARALAKALSARSLAWRFKHWTVPTRPEGMSVIGVTRAVDGAATVALTARWRPWTWRRRIAQFAKLGDLTLTNVHLTPHNDSRARAREVAMILQHLSRVPPGPRVIAGDFNALPDSTVLDELISEGLRDAWLASNAGKVGEGATNWPGPQARTGPPTQRIDYLWVSSDVAVHDASTPRYGEPGFERYPHLSDHLPLTVALEA